MGADRRRGSATTRTLNSAAQVCDCLAIDTAWQSVGVSFV
jgi:hypothetical protein